MPRADHDVGSGGQECLGDPEPDPADPAGDEYAATCIVNAAGVGHGLVRYPSKRLGEKGGPALWVSRSTGSGPIAEIVVDYPPVNALPVAGWFDLADA